MRIGWRLGRTRLRLLAAGRVGVGLGMLARPADLPKVLGVDSATAERMAWVTRMLGVREAVVGLGTLDALRSGGARPWVLGGAVVDAVDAAVFAGAAARGRVRPLLGGGFALAGAAIAAAQLAAALGPRVGEEGE